MLRATFVLALLAATPLTAQCGLTWAPGAPLSGPNGNVYALLSLPNGDLIAGGAFVGADAAPANRIARWDGAAWQAMGTGGDGDVRCLARMANGDVVAGGAFTAMGGAASLGVARWNGSSWAPMGTGLNGQVTALLALPNGELFATGSFLTAGSVVVNRVARWNGTAWGPLGNGPSLADGLALARRPNGDIFVGGDSATGTNALSVWTGTAWQTVPAFDPGTYSAVRSLAVLANGNLAVSGSFTIGGQNLSLAVWNGTTAQPLAPPIGLAGTLLALSNGDLLAASIGTTPPSLAQWNGTTWTTLSGAPAAVRSAVEDSSGHLVVASLIGGSLPRPTPVSRFDGSQWQRLGAPVPALPQTMLTMPNGDVVVGGAFTSFGGVAANNLARWNGSVWAPLGLGVDGPVRSLALATNGDVLVSGGFQNAGGAPANHIARWNGTVWATLGGGLPVDATSLAVAPNGDVYATAVGYGLRRFQAGQWSQITIPGAITPPLSVAVLANGNLAVGGVFSGSPLSGLAVQGPSGFTVLPNTPVAVQRMLVTRDGTLFAATGQGLQSWNGTSWTARGFGGTYAITEMPDGDILVGSATLLMPGSTTASSLSRLTPNGWVSVGAVQGGLATCLAISGRGEILAGGSFTTVAGSTSYGFTRAAPTCQAAALPIGSGCSGGAGPVTLTARSLPWTGAAFRADASGMTTNSLALQLVGLQAGSGPLPGGAPGCSLWLTPTIGDVLLPTGGVATAVFVVPNQPSLAGLTFRLQVVGIELGSSGIVRQTSTNALEATIGVL